MANTLYTPTQAARSTLAALRYLTDPVPHRAAGLLSGFVAGRGRTVDIPLSVTLSNGARDYTDANRAARDAIVFDEIAQTSTPVTMDKQVYSAVRLPDDFATFTLTSMETQVLRPQAEAVADAVVAPLVATMNGFAADAALSGANAVARTSVDVINGIIKARSILNSRNVPLAGRTLAVGVDVEALLLQNDSLQKANEAGSDGLLREATIGRLFGFDIVIAPDLTDDEAIAYNRDAFVHVTRPSRPPEGAAKSAVVSQDGFSLRWIQHYNPLQLEDQSVVDAWVGSKVLSATRAVKFKLAA